MALPHVLPQPFRTLLAEAQNSRKSLVDAPLLVWGDPAHQVAKPSGIDGADLLDEDASGLAQQVYLWPERRGPGAQRRRCDQHHRARKQLIGLHDHPVPPATLLVARSPWRGEFVNVTPQHACSP